MKYKECPMCRQLLVDLSDNPMFVNHNPPKDVQEAYNAHTRISSSTTSNLGNISPSNGHSSIPEMDKSTRKDSGRRKSLSNVVNLSKKEMSKDSTINKATVYRK